jgi:nucleoside-diphosphate-sugar epimerase
VDAVLQEDLDALLNHPCIEWNAFRGKSFLITGATGLVGSFIVRALENANRKIHTEIKIYGLVRDPQKAAGIFGADSSVIYIIGDVRKRVEIESDIDYIIHCAGITASKTMVSHPVETWMTAVDGTQNLLETAVKKQIESMVYVSSMEVYGTVYDEERMTEDRLGYVDISKVRSVYPEGKRACENLCKAYESEFGVNVKMARLAQTFGAGVSKEENRVFAQFAKSVIAGEDIVLHTKGGSYGNYCYTMDTVSAILCILQKGIAGEAYNVVNEETTMTIREMAEMAADGLGRKVNVVLDIPESALTYGYAPDTKLRLSGRKLRDLGWEPTYGLMDMYRRMIRSWDCRMAEEI